MSRYLGPKHKLCRREGVRLCDSPKCPVIKRNYPPGVHGVKGYPRLTPYGEQLREKQKAKRLYGIGERQFQNYFEKSVSMRGDTGTFILEMLESRLDNVIYRSGFAISRPQARQMVSHGFFLVNGKKVNIPSYQVQAKDTISIHPGKLRSKLFDEIDKKQKKHEFPEWMHYEEKDTSIKIISQPKLDPVKQLFQVRSIVEFYSR